VLSFNFFSVHFWLRLFKFSSLPGNYIVRIVQNYECHDSMVDSKNISSAEQDL